MSDVVGPGIASRPRRVLPPSATAPASSLIGSRFTIPTLALLLLALFFGGGTIQGLWSDAFVQLASLPLLGIALVSLATREIEREHRWWLILLGCVVLVPMLQIVPLPAGIWSRLPGRAEIVSAFSAAEIPFPWLSVSLQPSRTWRSLLSLLPAITLFLAVLQIDRRGRRVLTLLLIAFGLGSVMLGLAQIAQGPNSGLRFYSVTNPGEAVGFFANRNHFASLLCIVVPITGAWLVGLSADRRPELMVGMVLCGVIFASLLLGIGMTRSRAGVVLAGLAAPATFGLAAGLFPAGWMRRGLGALLLATVIGLVVVLSVAAERLAPLMSEGAGMDSRVAFATTTLRAASHYLPFGSGVGSFDAVYRIYENPEQLRRAYVNHAHNDYAELLLEASIPGVVLVVAFGALFAAAALRLWRPPSNGRNSALDLALARAGAVIVLLLLTHSLVDYPLRTTALSSVFAVGCALMLSPIRSARSRGPRSRRERREGDDRKPDASSPRHRDTFYEGSGERLSDA